MFFLLRLLFLLIGLPLKIIGELTDRLGSRASRMLANNRTWLRRYWFGPVAVVALAVIWAILWPLTDALASHDVSRYAVASRAVHVQSAREAVRTQALTLGAGLFAAAALFYTARNFNLARRQFAATEAGQRRTLHLTEQGQVTDRYIKAIEQLGSDKIDLRVGGIYALERIARDSCRDHPTVMEVLCAFVRAHSHEQWTERDQEQRDPKRSARPDVHAAVTVIARRDTANDKGILDLSKAFLAGVNLSGLNLSGVILVCAEFRYADLSGAYLTEAKLAGAHLDHAYLDGAHLDHAYLDGADLSDARLAADLTGAYLTEAKLLGAEFGDANLFGAFLFRANLSGVDLSGAGLKDAKFDGADLTGAKWPTNTPFPAGWKPNPATGLLEVA